MKPNKWHIRAITGGMASDGSPYYVSLRRGTVNKLLVNFAGGGFCWNEETAARPMNMLEAISGREAYYIPRLGPLMLRLVHVGALSASDARSPFHGWNVLNIPYTTGDFHMGCGEFPYKDAKGRERLLHHKGAANVGAALTLLKDFAQTPETLVIAGQSAGAFGCVANAHKVTAMYPGCRNVIIYSEGSHLNAPIWEETARHVWNVAPELAGYIKSRDLIVDLFRYARDKMPDSTVFLHSNTVWDGALTKFMNKMSHGKMAIDDAALAEFNETLIAATGKLSTEMPNYFHYLTDHGRKKDGSTAHLFFGDAKLMYEPLQDGVSVAEWLNTAIVGRPVSVGGGFLV
ncbi:MAG: pectin acetylesterase-family hydrolase [Defluviitaleaceae bacterium]|nr:pectin acetylesterase-family hydrolase [Defluviitaleaceae bacterium]